MVGEGSADATDAYAQADTPLHLGACEITPRRIGLYTVINRASRCDECFVTV